MDSNILVREKDIPLCGHIKYVYKQTGKAICDYRMLCDGDRVLVAVSGGKDSLALLKLLAMRQQRVPIDFSLFACFVRTDFMKIEDEPILSCCASLNIPCHIQEIAFSQDNVNCFWCSWNRRKLLFETARKLNCNKIALGHHRDDIIQTVLMNLFFLGEISAMKPKVKFFDNTLTLIRPLCYLTDEALERFIREAGIPFASWKCHYGKNSRRELMKNIIQEVEAACPQVKKNIFNALQKIKPDYLLNYEEKD